MTTANNTLQLVSLPVTQYFKYCDKVCILLQPAEYHF